MDLKGNKGEWSEIYTLFKLLADRKLYAADAELNKIDSISYEILKIFRKEKDAEKIEFNVSSVIEIIDSNGEKFCEIPIDTFRDKAAELFDRIKTADGPITSPETQNFMYTMRVTKVKEGSDSKRDITVMVHDKFTNHDPILGFSIKSQLGGDSTLFNVGQKSNITYSLSKNIDKETISKINTKKYFKDKIKLIEEAGSSLVFSDIEASIFKNNLIMVDSMMPVIFSDLVLHYFKGKGRKMSELLTLVEESNPCNYENFNETPLYEYKIKNLMTDMALGMTANKKWTGIYDATGGYIVVKTDGELVCYHIYNRNEFQKYLMLNTYVDTPSASRHKFGFVYEDNKGNQYFKLNAQIRFS